MARTALTLQNVNRTGLAPTYAAANVDGNAWNNDGQDVILHVKNASGGPITVTVQVPGTLDGVAKADKAYVVGAGAEVIAGPFPSSLYNQDDSGGDTGLKKAVLVDYSGVTSLTVAAFKIGSLAY